MCGLAGTLDLARQTAEDDLRARVARMAATLVHRGPDSEGTWVDAAAGIAFGHRRLAIIDLSPTGHQPMVSADGRFVIVYNGETYNFRELRRELEARGTTFRGHSDTEVALEAIAAWGIEDGLSRLNGMFAFALWDRTERRLHLVRDRLGIKPLYYGRQGDSFLFASELRALRAHPAFAAEIDRDALALYMRHNVVPRPGRSSAASTSSRPARCSRSMRRGRAPPDPIGRCARLPSGAARGASGAIQRRWPRSSMSCCAMRSSGA